jgi:MFS family permease
MMLINREFARLWYGQAISQVGDFVFDTTVVLWIVTKLGAGRGWTPAAVSGVLIAAGLAMFAVGPVAGVLVDRWDHRRTMLGTEVLRAILTGALAALAFLPASALPTAAWLTVLYVVVFGVNAAGSFFGPARMAAIGSVVTGEADRARAGGITQSTMAAAGMIGPPLATPLVFGAGVPWAIMINALSYLASYLAIRSVVMTDTASGEAQAPAASSFRKEFVEGLRFYKSSPVLVTLLVLALIANSGTGALNTLDIFFVMGNLHSAPKLFGVMGMACGAGSIAGGLLSGKVVGRLGARTAIWATTAAAGLAIVLYARQTSFWAGIPLFFLLGVPLAMVNAAFMPMMYQVVPREFLGRAFSVIIPGIRLVQLLSTIAAGWLMSTVMRHFHADLAGLHLGPIDTVFSVVGILFLVAAVYGAVMLPSKASTDAAATAPIAEFAEAPDAA